uniref:Uncharacterized protein n=1 Tax=Arundo donax TaxID=35708 RepID=A0A0A8YUC2_ARUDO
MHYIYSKMDNKMNSYIRTKIESI